MDTAAARAVVPQPPRLRGRAARPEPSDRRATGVDERLRPRQARAEEERPRLDAAAPDPRPGPAPREGRRRGRDERGTARGGAAAVPALPCRPARSSRFRLGGYAAAGTC